MNAIEKSLRSAEKLPPTAATNAGVPTEEAGMASHLGLRASRYAGSELFLQYLADSWEDFHEAVDAITHPLDSYSTQEWARTGAEFLAMARALTRVFGFWPLAAVEEVWRHGMNLKPGQGLLRRLTEAQAITSLPRRGYRVDALPETTLASLLGALDDLPLDRKVIAPAKTALNDVARRELARQLKMRPSQVTLRHLREHGGAIDLADYLVLGENETTPKEFLDAAGEVAAARTGTKGKDNVRNAVHRARSNAGLAWKLLVMAGVVPGPLEGRPEPRMPKETPWPDLVADVTGKVAHPEGIPLGLVFRALRSASARADLTPRNATPAEWKKAFSQLSTWQEDGTEEPASIYGARTAYRKRLHGTAWVRADAPDLPKQDEVNLWPTRDSKRASVGDFSGIGEVCPAMAHGPYGLRPFWAAYRGDEDAKETHGLPAETTHQAYGDIASLVRTPTTQVMAVNTWVPHVSMVARLVTWAHKAGHIHDLEQIDMRDLLLIRIKDADGEVLTLVEAWARAHPASSEHALRSQHPPAGVICLTLSSIAAPCLANVAYAAGDQVLARDLVHASNLYHRLARSWMSKASNRSNYDGSRLQAISSVAWLSANGRIKNDDLLHELGRVRTAAEEELVALSGCKSLQALYTQVVGGHQSLAPQAENVLEEMVVMMLLVRFALRPEELGRLQRDCVDLASGQIVLSPFVRKKWKLYERTLGSLQPAEYQDPDRGSHWDMRIWKLWFAVLDARVAAQGLGPSPYALLPRNGGADGGDLGCRRMDVAKGKDVAKPGLRHSQSTFRALTKRVVDRIRRALELGPVSQPARPGLKAPGNDLYILRHAVATARLAMGESPTVVAALLGHSEAMTTEVYNGWDAATHDYDDPVRQHAKRRRADGEGASAKREKAVQLLVARGHSRKEALEILDLVA